MEMIQTVTGVIDKADVGTVLMHEHVTCTSISFNRAFGGVWFDRDRIRTLSCETLQRMRQTYGLGLMVDATPIDLGRNITLLKEVSELSGVKIVASTGFYYLQSIEAAYNDAEELAGWLIRECEKGIEGTDIKPGILKCATGKAGITMDNRIKLLSMGMVQKQTGLPLYIHCEHQDDMIYQQIDTLLESGANTEKLIVGHASIRPDVEYLEKILGLGCYVCMDQCHCHDRNLNMIADTLVRLCKKGYTDNLLISNDYCIHSDFCKRERNGLHLSAAQHTENLGYIFDRLHGAYIAMNGNEKDWNTMLCKNPINLLDVG